MGQSQYLSISTSLKLGLSWLPFNKKNKNQDYPCPNLMENLKVVGTILITINFEQKSVCQPFEKRILDKDSSKNPV